jgi:hypothetical protein
MWGAPDKGRLELGAGSRRPLSGALAFVARVLAACAASYRRVAPYRRLHAILALSLQVLSTIL